MKKIIVAGLVFTLALSAVGCGPKEAEAGEVSVDNATVVSVENGADKEAVLVDGEENRTEEGYYISPTDEFELGDVITAGEVMEFDGKYIHIISGDLVQVYKYDGNNKDFYIGQSVKLLKGEDEDYLTKTDVKDFSVTHTNMGHPIDQIDGTVLSFDKEHFVVKSGDNEIKFSYYDENLQLVKGEEIQVYGMKFSESEDYSSVMILQKDNQMRLTVTELTRTDDGSLNALLKDKDNGEYSINLSHVMTELDIADVKVGDELTVFYKAIMESYPMQLDVVIIRK
ncbi:MAG: hypothetical protein N4A76_15270 [Firmicutes bacterium]|jgi:hypothetical protein|nr:hypothetical protein [Bacillota bacterium]